MPPIETNEPNGKREQVGLGLFLYSDLAPEALCKSLGLSKPFQSSFARYGFDTAYASGDGLLADDFQHADVADAMNVCAAAQFFRAEPASPSRIGNRYAADVVVRIPVV